MPPSTGQNTLKPRPRNVVAPPATSAKFNRLLKRAAEKGERIMVSQPGKPGVVMMSIRDYIRTIAPTPPALRALQREAESNGTSSMTMREIDAEIAAHRREVRERELTKAAAKKSGNKPVA
jgi:prevent-host-death family protein